MYLAPYVTEEMQNVEYWLNKTDMDIYPEKGIIKTCFNSNGVCVKNAKMYLDDNMTQINSTVLINDPVNVRDEGSCYRVTTPYASGYMQKSDIALCDDYMWQNNPEDIVIIADRILLDKNIVNYRISSLNITMGTCLKEMFRNEAYVNSEGRLMMNSYIVRVPYRKPDGMAAFDYAPVASSGVAKRGFLPYTRENILRLAFGCLGDRYGWGGLYGGRDCSSYVLDIFRCFGIILPRNSSMQALAGSESIDVSNMDNDNKVQIIKEKGPGALVYFPGHIAIYIGENNNRLYVISATGNVDGMKVESVIINTLNSRRHDGTTWLSNISRVVVI